MQYQITSHEYWKKARHTQLNDSKTSDLTVPGVIGLDAAPRREWSNAGTALSFAASPTFAMMAVLTGLDGGSMANMLCSAGGARLSLGGMSMMYLLMSAFHLGPWLKLLCSRRNSVHRASCMAMSQSA